MVYISISHNAIANCGSFYADYRMNGSYHLIFLASLFLCLEVLVELRREEGLAEALGGLEIVRFLFQGGRLS